VLGHAFAIFYVLTLNVGSLVSILTNETGTKGVQNKMAMVF
jgi:hypothetical protein